MERTKFAPLSGFVPLTPEQQAKFDQLKDLVARVHHAYGFRSLDLPLIYRTEALLAKSGGETDKQIFRIDKGGDDGAAGLALRFDLTVPLAMFIANNERNLAFPLKVSQIGRSYRGEKVQRGREREFYQCDIDVIARGKLAVAYDAEVVAGVAEIYRQMGIGGVTIRIGNRRLLGGFLQSLGLADTAGVMAVIDDAEKVSGEELRRRFSELGVGDGEIAQIERLISFSGNLAEFKASEWLAGDNELFQQGRSELIAVMEQLAARGVNEAVIDLQIVRGLDYYTGTVFETRLDAMPEIGSIGSGGRYDNLVANYSAEPFEGVGLSIGLTRIFNSLLEAGKLPELPLAEKVLLIPVEPAQIEFCLKTSAELRARSEMVDVYLQGGKLDKALSYAAKSGASTAIIIGEAEVAGKPLERRVLY